MMKKEEIELEIWEKSKKLKDYEQINVKDDWKKVKSRIQFEKRYKKISFSTYFVRIAAVIILAVGLSIGLPYVFKKLDGTQNLHALSSGNIIKNYTLPDNSQVTLNKDSKLYYNIDFNKLNRELILEGEAYFEVKYNKDLPFIIHTTNSSIKVLGTKFNVRMNKENTTVSVVDGIVSLFETENDTNHTELIKNQTGIFTFDKSDISKKDYIDPNCLAWKTGILVFDDTPLQIVFQTVASFYNLDPVININTELTYTSSFKNPKLEEVLKEIEKVSKNNFEVISTEKELIVTQRQ